MSTLRTSRSSEDTKRWPLASSGSSAGLSVQQGFVASRVRALQQQQNRGSECNPRPRSKPTFACSHATPEAGPSDASLEHLPADPCSNIAITNIDNRSNRPSERYNCNQKKACPVTSIPEQLLPRARSSAKVDTRSHRSDYEQRHTHTKTKTLSCVKESMYPRFVPPLDDPPDEGKSLPTNPAQQQPEPCPGKDFSTQVNPVTNNDCDSKRCSSDLSLSSNKSETGMLDMSTGDPANSVEGPTSLGGTEHQASVKQSTRTGSSINRSEPLGLNQPSPRSRDDFDSGTPNRHRNFESATASRSLTPPTPDASIGHFERFVDNDENQSSTDAEIWTTKADDHLPKERMAVESLSGLKTHSSAESLVSNDHRTLERRRSSLAIRNVSESTVTDQIEPNLDKQVQKDASRRNGSALGNLFTGKWLRTVVESKTPQVNHEPLRRQGVTSSNTHGMGKEIDGDETTDHHDSHRIPMAKASDVAATTSSGQTTMNVNAVHYGSTVSRTATPPATPGLPAEQSKTVPEEVFAKAAMKGSIRQGKSPFHQSMLVPATSARATSARATSARASPLEYPTYPVKDHAVNSATAEKPAAVKTGDLRLTITIKDGITQGTTMRRAKVTILLEPEEDLRVEANVKKVERES